MAKSDSELRLCWTRELLPKPTDELRRQYIGGAGKDSLDGIRNFAGFGSQSLGSDSLSPGEEGNSPVL